MSFGQPWALALFALAVPLVVIHLLRGAYRPRSTTAAFLWRGLEEQITARRRWRPPPRSLALLLQLLGLTVGVLALAQPYMADTPGRQVVYLLDASASMQATDVAPSRFEAGRAAVLRSLTQLGPGDRATVIRLGARPVVLAGGANLAAVRAAVEQAQPGAAVANLRDGLALARQFLESPYVPGSEVVVVTDGSLAEPPGLGPLPVPVRFELLGQRSNNQGVSTLEVRRPPSEAVRLTGFATLTNYADTAVRVPARITADGLPLETRLAELPPRGRAELPFDVPPAARSVGVTLLGRDDLSVDDQVEVTVPENRRHSVLLVSRLPEVWEHALGAIPGLEVTTRLPSTYQDTGADLVVLDGFVPPKLPGGQILLVNPPAGNPLVEVLGETRDTPFTSFGADQPLLRSIDLAALRLVRAPRLAVPRWATPVAEGPGGPLILQGQLDGRRVVVLGFDPLLSGLEKLVAFPLLVANSVDYLVGSGTDPYVAPGRLVTLPVAAEALEVVLQRPDGTRLPLQPNLGVVEIDSTEQVGRYTVRQRLPNQEPQARSFLVALLGEGEADTTPRRLADRPAVADAAPAAPPAAAPPTPWAALVSLMLGLLAVEWLHFVRRG